MWSIVPLLVLSFQSAQAADAAAEALARKSGCFKCHAIDKEKVGPRYKDIAAKYKDDPSAEDKLFTHLTTNPVVEVDGEEEEHTGLKTKNEGEVRQVIRWIRSL
jgi:cytochrome c